MMTNDDYKKVSEIVQADNARQIISEIINTYGLQSADNASFIMKETNDLMIFMVNHRENKANQYEEAAKQMIKGVDASNGKAYLLYLLRICMPLFPECQVAPDSPAEELNFFNQLFGLLLPPSRAFDWNSKSDWKWAKDNGVDKYLKKMQYRYSGLR